MITAVFVDSVFNIKNSFAEKSTKHLKLSAEKLHFKSDLDTECQEMNDRVLDETNGKINNLFPKS